MKLILVRHTRLNIEEGICYGQSDVLPTTKFADEAKLVRTKLKEFNPDIVFTSPLKRCKMLAEACGYRNALEEKRLIEYNFGNWEMEEWKNIHGEYAKRWMEDYISVPAPNGDSMEDLINRLNDFIIDLKRHDYSHVLCFTHSGPIRVVDYLVNKIPIEKLFDIKVDFGGVFIYTI